MASERAVTTFQIMPQHGTGSLSDFGTRGESSAME